MALEVYRPAGTEESLKNRRAILVTIGATTPGAALVIGGIAVPSVLAHESYRPRSPLSTMIAALKLRITQASAGNVAALDSELNIDNSNKDQT